MELQGEGSFVESLEGTGWILQGEACQLRQTRLIAPLSYDLEAISL